MPKSVKVINSPLPIRFSLGGPLALLMIMCAVGVSVRSSIRIEQLGKHVIPAALMPTDPAKPANTTNTTMPTLSANAMLASPGLEQIGPRADTVHASCPGASVRGEAELRPLANGGSS